MPCSGRPSEFDEDQLKALLKEESCQTSHELAKKMNCDQKTILNHFQQCDVPKNWESECLMSLAKTTKKITFKLLLNILPSSNMQSQTALFVPNCHGR